MIAINILHDQAHHVLGAKIRGHAGKATYGSDVICSAVSVLALSTINGLEHVAHAKIEKSVGEGDIYFRLAAQNDENAMAASQILLQSFANAIQNIAEENAEYVTAAYEEVKK